MLKNVKARNILIIAIAVVLAVGLLLGLTLGLCLKDKCDFSKSLDLPVMRIETENKSEIVSKEDYLNCKVSVSNTEQKFEFSEQTGRIRGRGNSTWTWFPKKPYKLKFDSKVNLFGNGKAKTWTLIANYGDPSMLRNYLAYSVADTFDDLQYTTTSQFVDLYVNGSYRGVYQVCEQVEVKTNRVEIEDPFDVDDYIEKRDTGYLIEMDYRAKDEGELDRDYFVAEGLNFAIKSPDTEQTNFSSAYVQFIKGYMQSCFEGLKGSDYGRVCELLDVKTFADSYILHELFNTKDVNFSSFYMYKDAGGKLCSGPVWDFDLSSGNSNSDESNIAQNLYAKTNLFYNYLLRFDEFKALVSEKLDKYHDKISQTINEKITFVEKNYSKSFERNFKLWTKVLGKKRWCNSVETGKLKTWKAQLKYLKDWLDESLEFISAEY